MEINCITQTNLKWQDHSDPDLEFERMDEDDVFYAELRKQVLLLIADEDEDEDRAFAKTRHSNNYCNACKQGSRSSPTNRFPTILQPGSYFSWWDKEIIQSVPTWLVKSWRNGNGTGVFIPQIIKTRRYRRGRTTNNRRRTTYKHKENY